MSFNHIDYIYHATSSVYLSYIKLYGFGKFPDEIYIPMKKIYDKKIFNMEDISLFITNQEKIRKEQKFMDTWFTTYDHLKDIEFYGINGRLQGLEEFNNNLKQWKQDNLSNEEIKKDPIWNITSKLISIFNPFDKRQIFLAIKNHEYEKYKIQESYKFNINITPDKIFVYEKEDTNYGIPQKIIPILDYSNLNEYFYHATSSLYIPYIKRDGLGRYPDELYTEMREIFEYSTALDENGHISFVYNRPLRNDGTSTIGKLIGFFKGNDKIRKDNIYFTNVIDDIRYLPIIIKYYGHNGTIGEAPTRFVQLLKEFVAKNSSNPKQINKPIWNTIKSILEKLDPPNKTQVILAIKKTEDLKKSISGGEISINITPDKIFIYNKDTFSITPLLDCFCNLTTGIINNLIVELSKYSKDINEENDKSIYEERKNQIIDILQKNFNRLDGTKLCNC